MNKLLTTIMLMFALMFLAACSGNVQAATSKNEAVSSHYNADTSKDEVVTKYIFGSGPHYESIDEMADAATDIIRAVVLDEWVDEIDFTLRGDNEEHLDATYFITTIHQVKVMEVFQGYSEVGDILEVLQLGGRLGNTIIISVDMLPINIGDDLVFFLVRRGNDNEWIWILNNNQAAYRFDERQRSRDAELERLSDRNRIALTLGDLIQISENNMD